MISYKNSLKNIMIGLERDCSTMEHIIMSSCNVGYAMRPQGLYRTISKGILGIMPVNDVGLKEYILTTK